MEYTILIGPNGILYSATNKLIEEVNKYIQQGWEPLGGISITYNGIATQAMIRLDKPL